MEKAEKISAEQMNKVKETLANTAVGELEQGEDFEKLDYTTVEFGYIYLRDGKYESLFKIITDKKTVFFCCTERKSDAFAGFIHGRTFSGYSRTDVGFPRRLEVKISAKAIQKIKTMTAFIEMLSFLFC